MKYICLFFDDSRKDTYSHVLSIMEKCVLKEMVNVISSFVLNKEPKENFNFKSSNFSMSSICGKKENEIVCHGRKHCNSLEDIFQNIRELKIRK